MTALVLTALLVPFVAAGAALTGPPGLRRFAPWSLLVSMACLVATEGRATSTWWGVDRVGLVLGLLALVIGLCVCRYSVRQFDGEARQATIVAASLVVVGAVLGSDLAQNLGALVACWIATSIATLVVLASGAGMSQGSPARLAAKAFVLGDVVLLVGAGAAMATSNASLASSWHDHVGGTAAFVLLGVAGIAALVRAGISTRQSWVIATVRCPTSISALLHAGVVNAGALLLLRIELVAGSRVAISAALGALCVASMVTLAPRIHVRVDLKGQLAASTVSQMAFMLLALALGWPLLALTHLVGHALYKAGRFMASGGAIETRARLRRRATRGTQLSLAAQILGLSALLVVAFGIGIAMGNNGLAAMGVFGPAAGAVWWVRTREPVVRPGVLWIASAATLALYGVIVDALGRYFGDAIAVGGWRAPWWVLGTIAVALASVTALRQARLQRPATSIARLVSPVRRHVEEVAA
jgi:NAD(P)H-quinone oxidoreductase subunit 5